MPLQPVRDMELLLEMVTQGNVNEGSSAGDHFHGRGESTLDDGQIADREVPPQIVDIGQHLQSVFGGDRRRVDTRAGDHHNAKAGDQSTGVGICRDDPVQEI